MLGTRGGSKKGRNSRCLRFFISSFILRLCRLARSFELGHIFKKIEMEETKKRNSKPLKKEPEQNKCVTSFFVLSLFVLWGHPSSITHIYACLKRQARQPIPCSLMSLFSSSSFTLAFAILLIVAHTLLSFFLTYSHWWLVHTRTRHTQTATSH